MVNVVVRLNWYIPMIKYYQNGGSWVFAADHERKIAWYVQQGRPWDKWSVSYEGARFQWFLNKIERKERLDRNYEVMTKCQARKYMKHKRISEQPFPT